MPSALLVSWFFPPHRSIGAKRPYRFACGLPAHGWRPVVLCQRPPGAYARDESAWPVPDGVRVVADYDPAAIRALENFLTRGRTKTAAPAPGPSTSRGGAGASLTRAVSSLENVLVGAVPTELAAIHAPHAVRVGARLAREERASVVWSTSAPYSAHLVGVALKRRLGLPFVADLRDPWTLNFVHTQKMAHARWVERRLEALVFEHADRVTVTTEALADAYRAAWPRYAHKLVTIRNAFEPAVLPPRVLSPDRVRLVHFGNLYADRSLGCVFEALARLRARGALGDRPVVVENYGRMTDEDRARIDALGVSDLVSVCEPIPYDRSLPVLRSADLLLLPAQIVGGDDALFLPGKLYDYLRASAPVLALGDSPELARILAHTRAGVQHRPDDVDGIASVLEAAVRRALPFEPDAAAVGEYAAPHATAKLAAIFDEVTRRPAT